MKLLAHLLLLGIFISCQNDSLKEDLRCQIDPYTSKTPVKIQDWTVYGYVDQIKCSDGRKPKRIVENETIVFECVRGKFTDYWSTKDGKKIFSSGVFEESESGEFVKRGTWVVFRDNGKILRVNNFAKQGGSSADQNMHLEHEYMCSENGELAFEVKYPVGKYADYNGTFDKYFKWRLSTAKCDRESLQDVAISIYDSIGFRADGKTELSDFDSLTSMFDEKFKECKMEKFNIRDMIAISNGLSDYATGKTCLKSFSGLIKQYPNMTLENATELLNGYKAVNECILNLEFFNRGVTAKICEKLLDPKDKTAAKVCQDSYAHLIKGGFSKRMLNYEREMQAFVDHKRSLKN